MNAAFARTRLVGKMGKTLDAVLLSWEHNLCGLEIRNVFARTDALGGAFDRLCTLANLSVPPDIYFLRKTSPAPGGGYGM
jgi:hypothetical protein